MDQENRPADGRHAHPGVPVVGIGASAGGVEALRLFFRSIPTDSGLAFVVIQHQDPTQPSMLADILGRETTMKVAEVAEPTSVEANHVYLAPPGKYLALSDRMLELNEPGEQGGHRIPIDFFFRSLARSCRERAIGIVLSGTGSEGALGVKEIHAHGGLVLVQALETAAHEGMPRSAVETGIADLILPIEEMSEALLSYIRHAYSFTQRDEGKPPDLFTAILALVRSRTHRDFRWYKKSTLRRRMERRMGLRRVEDLAEYLDLLRNDPIEVNQLFRDFLISVTSFFREPQTWDILAEEFLQPLIQRKEPGVSLRIWVPGCATGEEAYSVAMLVHEQLELAEKDCAVQVFATDINEQSLDFARMGIYPSSISSDVSPERLRHHFVQLDNHRYQVSKTIRASVAFAVQDIITDPPFSRLDLITCRNLLIYLETEAQKKVLGLFHFTLTPGGALFLGSSENVNQQDGQFEPINRPCHLYRRIGKQSVDSLMTSVASEEQQGRPFPGFVERFARPPGQNFAEIGRQVVLEEFAPASVLIDRHRQILYLHGPTSRYLQQSSGVPHVELMDMVPAELAVRLRGALHRAQQDQEVTVMRHVRFPSSGKSALSGEDNSFLARVTVKPKSVRGTQEPLFLISFAEENDPTPPNDPLEPLPGDARGIIQQLEHELQSLREELQSSLEEGETVNEELKASNEELSTTNEELRSSNEELETSKEELQSLNEELNTVNGQLQEKVAELERTNNDLSNLLNSTDIATLFLDSEFRIKLYTPITSRLLNLIPSDVGRPLGDMAQKFTDQSLIQDAQQVLANLLPIEKEIESHDGRWDIRRIVPYRTRDNRIEGVVVTFTDVTAIRDAREEAHTRARQQSVLASLGVRVLQGGPHEGDSAVLVEEVLPLIAETLHAEQIALFRLQPDGQALLLEAGVGWKPGCVGQTTIRAGSEYQFGYTLQQRTVTVVDNYAEESRFLLSPLLHEHGVEAGITVPVPCQGPLPGVLGVYTSRPRSFTSDDTHFVQVVANILTLAMDRNQQDEELQKLNRTLEERIEQRTALMQLLQHVAMTANMAEQIEEVLLFVLQRVCEYNGWDFGHVWQVNTEDRNEVIPTRLWYMNSAKEIETFRQTTMRSRIRAGEGLVGRVLQSRVAEWTENIGHDASCPRRDAAAQVGLGASVAFPVLSGPDLTHVLEFFAPVSSRPDQAFLEAMVSVGTQLGRVVERQRFQAQLAEVVWQEQQRLGQELHDTLGQELTGLGMLARSIQGSSSSGDERLTDIVQGLQSATRQVRSIAHGLFPVELDDEGLHAALVQLARSTRERYGIQCVVTWDEAAVIPDGSRRKHLYFILREAVTNAAKHAQCQRIDIRLEAGPGNVHFRVRDDGVGIPEASQSSQGMGMRIMRYRASLIGATLEVGSAEGSGTVVTCTLNTGNADE